MKDRYLPAINREKFVRPGLSRLQFAVPSSRANHHRTYLKSLLRLLKTLSLMLASNNSQVLSTELLLLESMLKVAIHSRKSLLVEDVLDLLAIAATLDLENQWWVKIRAAFLTAIQ
jgi:hypothetical protein